MDDQAFAAQQQVLTKLAALGVIVRPDSATPVGSTASRPRSIRARSRCSVRCRRSQACSRCGPHSRVRLRAADRLRRLRATSGHRATAELPGFDGRGVTIALRHGQPDEFASVPAGQGASGDRRRRPSRRCNCARESPGSGPDRAARDRACRASSSAPAAPGACTVAPGATVLPIRVAGWQAAADGRAIVFGRTDQVIAGLERAVDPNGDGDVHDAVRVALLGVAAAVCGVHRRPRGAGGAGGTRPEHARGHARGQRRPRRAELRLDRRPGRQRPGRWRSAQPIHAPTCRGPGSCCAAGST